MAKGVDATVNSTQYGRYIEAIPIDGVEYLDATTETTYTATDDCIIYQVGVGDDGVKIENVYVNSIICGGWFVDEGQSITLKGHYIVIK